VAINSVKINFLYLISPALQSVRLLNAANNLWQYLKMHNQKAQYACFLVECLQADEYVDCWCIHDRNAVDFIIVILLDFRSYYAQFICWCCVAQVVFLEFLFVGTCPSIRGAVEWPPCNGCTKIWLPKPQCIKMSVDLPSNPDWSPVILMWSLICILMFILVSCCFSS